MPPMGMPPMMGPMGMQSELATMKEAAIASAVEAGALSWRLARSRERCQELELEVTELRRSRRAAGVAGAVGAEEPQEPQGLQEPQEPQQEPLEPRSRRRRRIIGA